MWGICLNSFLCEGSIFQRVIEYRLDDNNKAIIVQPVSNVEINIQNIKALNNLPKYKYGDIVSLVYNMNIKEKIIDIVYHFKNQIFNYYIEVNNIKRNKRYYETDFIKL